jgi:deazaflavin-dependent oxidoreductase (nitroreductase family)
VPSDWVVTAHYRAPGGSTRNIVNRVVAFLARHGVSILGSRVLAVKGQASGMWRTTPVNVLDHDGHRYLVSVRGHGHWVRNLRAAGTGELRLGKRVEVFRSRELTDDEKVPVLRAYLKRWKFEVSPFFPVSDQTPLTSNYTLLQPIIPTSKFYPWPDHSTVGGSNRHSPSETARSPAS